MAVANGLDVDARLERVIDPPRRVHHRLDPPLTPGEAAVVDILDGVLAPAWEIYLQAPLNRIRPDTVLLNPNVGVVVIEVKDWRLREGRFEFRARGNGAGELWGEVDGELRRLRNPVDQALAYRSEIARLYCPRLRRRFGVQPLATSVVFPFASDAEVKSLFGSASRAHLPPALRESVQLVGRDALEERGLDTLVPSALWLNRPEMTPELAEDLRSWLVEPDFLTQRRQLPGLTAKQQDAIATRTGSGYRRIRGAAGSGKTLVVAGRAAALQRDGKDVLVLTYTKTLPDYIRGIAASFPCDTRRVTWRHFHGWCADVLNVAGERMPRNPTDEDFEVRIPARASEILDSPLGEEVDRYDAILVDEGQDFSPAWWATLRRVLRPGGEMLLAADRAQDIFEKGRYWTEQAMSGAGFSGPWTEFGESFRMPAQLTELSRAFAERFLPGAVDLLPATPTQGALEVDVCRLRWTQSNAEDLVGQAAQAVLDTLAGSLGARPVAAADIVVLADRNATGQAVVQRLAGYGVTPVHTFSLGGGVFSTSSPAVKATTVQSFKGWEARALVVVLGHASSDYALRVAYIGMTRLKAHPDGSYLTIVCGDRRLEGFGRTWPEFVQP